MHNRDDESVTPGSTNIFADLGLPDAEERQLKGQLAGKIVDRLEKNGWTQTHAARVLGLSQPDVSRLHRGLLKDFSIGRLLHLVSKLDYRVTIVLEDTAGTAEGSLSGSTPIGE